MSAAKSARLRVVVDGSNLATEGRVTPSLTQLDEAVRAYHEENPGAEIIVVADATFEHRAATNERGRFAEAMLAGEIVTPPAGAVGRGDAFILKIADRIDAVVLSNDSFQEFHDEYPWLFDVGRLVGGKPVRGVGWIFTPRLPVRNAKTSRAVKKLAVTLAGGATPTVGTTLTPVKGKRAAATTKKATAKPAATPVKAPEKSVAKTTTTPLKGLAKSGSRAIKRPVVEAPVEKKAATKRPAKTAVPAPKKTAELPAGTVALRRGRQPVNPEEDFDLFRKLHRVGSRVHGEVTTFTSHGAIVTVVLKGGRRVECYAPTATLASPAPARARDVLKRGDERDFKLLTVDVERRIAELALA